MNQQKENIRKRKTVLTSTSGLTENGKLPPQAVDLEEAVLGAILIEKEALNTVIDLLSPELFYKDQNARVCEAILSCKEKNVVIDILTVTQECKALGTLEIIGGAYYITSLTNRIASSANIEFHLRIVQEAFMKREIIRISTGMIKEAYEDGSDVFEIKDQLEKTVFELTSNLGSFKFSDPKMLMDRLLEENARMIANTSKVSGVPSCFDDLDAVIHGWQKSDLIILAARPGMGKTAFVIQCAKNAALKHNIPVGVFSLEQSDLQLFKRICSQETEIPLEQFMHTGMDESTVNVLIRDTKELCKGKLFIDDSGGLHIMEMKSRIRRMVMQFGVKLVIIDYLQMMPGEPGSRTNREQEIEAISRGLKSLAKELDIPIIALSQLSREVENRPGGQKLPQLSDLRGSGAIEQDADVVMFIYRPEYYGIEIDANNESTKGKAKIIIAKNRHGSLEHVDLRWKGECVMFKNVTPSLEETAAGINPLNANTGFLEKKKNNDDEPF